MVSKEQNMVIKEAQWILNSEYDNVPLERKELAIQEFLEFFKSLREKKDDSLVLKALAVLIKYDCQAYGCFIKFGGFKMLRSILLTRVEEMRGDATFMSSLEGLLTGMIYHDSQQPCMCNDECQWNFCMMILTIPFLWKYFPDMRYVFVSGTPWILYIHKLGQRLQLTNGVFDIMPSCTRPSHACLLDNLLEIARIFLSHFTCSFDTALDFSNVLSMLVEKSMDVSKDYHLDLQKDNIRTIIMDDELSKEITRKLHPSFFCKMASALSVAPEGEEDKQLVAWVSLSDFLYHSFHSFIETECGKEIFSELLTTTKFLKSLWKILNIGIGDSPPKVLVIFSLLYKHMFLEELDDDVELLFQMENMIDLLKNELWNLLWVIPAKASYPVTLSDLEDDPETSDRKVSDKESSSDLEDFFFEDSDSDSKVGAKVVSGQSAHLEKKKRKKATDIKVADDLEVSDQKIFLDLAKHRACLRMSELLRELVYYNICPHAPHAFYVQIEDDVGALFISKVRPKDQRVRRVMLLAPFLVSFATRRQMFSGKLEDKRPPEPDPEPDPDPDPEPDPVPDPKNRKDKKHYWRIRRHQLLRDAVNLFQFVLPGKGLLLNKVAIAFVDENGVFEGGLDTGGIFNEFIENVAKAGFSVEHGVFKENCCGLLYPFDEERKTVTWNNEEVQAQKRTDSWCSWFFFLGTVLGKALFDEIPVNIQFTPFFLRKLISQGRTRYVKDLLGHNPELYANLKKLKKVSDDEFFEMGLSFSVEVDKEFVKLKADGKPELAEDGTPVLEVKKVSVNLTKNGEPVLAEDGTPMRVTTRNVFDYIFAMASYCLDNEAEAKHQTNCFLSSFHRLIRKDWISIFNARELQFLISGVPGLDVEYLRDNCKYYGGYHNDHQVIRNFWEVLTGFPKDAQIKFLQFVTGLSVQQLPRASNSKSIFEIHWIDDSDSLPTSAACNNTLRLPPYTSKEVLASKLWMAIHETTGFYDDVWAVYRWA